MYRSALQQPHHIAQQLVGNRRQPVARATAKLQTGKHPLGVASQTFHQGSGIADVPGSTMLRSWHVITFTIDHVPISFVEKSLLSV
ncbi:MAG: hypothetical protein QNJ58_26900 [Desulfobacterales bacterium]|nr:hypothetical protein [Desulfobacterales bacterium]